MKKPRSFVPVSLALSLGAIVVSCWSFTSVPDNAGTTGGSGGSPGGGDTGGSPGGGDTGGSPGGTGTGGAVGGTGTGGAVGGTGTGGAVGTGGSPGGTGTGGAVGTGGRGGSAGIAGTGGAVGTGGAASGGATGTTGPCDILAAANNPCAAAHSTVRALYGSYTGPLYQVCKGASQAGPMSCLSGMTKDIGVVAGGYADSGAQDLFCAGGTCTISIIYDQTANKNDLRPAPSGGPPGPAPDNPAVATDLKTTINGHTVYGVFIKPATGYRAACTGCVPPLPPNTLPKGTATGDQPETEYMVTSWNGLVDGCCFDYGNAETDSHDDNNGTMEAVYFGGGVFWGTGNEAGHNSGAPPNGTPWVMADLENGLFAGFNPPPAVATNAQKVLSNTALPFTFVTAMIVGDVASKNNGMGRFAIYGADATTGNLKVMYDGIRPTLGGYVPMQKQGSIILGIGGDNSKADGGQWFEGVMASGAATLATANAVQANIVAARYGK
jgi:non-reducing end alpha-L-arabinofuranosidase